MPTSKIIITSLLLVSIIIISSMTYYSLTGNKSGAAGMTLASQVKVALKDASSTRSEASKKVSEVRTRKPLDQVIQISCVLTPETGQELQAREQEGLEAISSLEIALVASENVVRLQTIQVAHLERTVFLQRVLMLVAGVLILIIIVL